MPSRPENRHYLTRAATGSGADAGDVKFAVYIAVQLIALDQVASSDL